MKKIVLAAAFAACLSSACAQVVLRHQGTRNHGTQTAGRPAVPNGAREAASVPKIAAANEDQVLDAFAEKLIQDDSLTLEMWTFPSQITAVAPITIDGMKNGTNSMAVYQKADNREKIVPILQFLMAQYRQSKIRTADESDAKHFSHSRAWLEFCSSRTRDCLVANIPAGLEWRHPGLNYQFQTRPHGGQAKIYGLGKLETKAFRPLLQTAF